jgi:hypothetical protein
MAKTEPGAVLEVYDLLLPSLGSTCTVSVMVEPNLGRVMSPSTSAASRGSPTPNTHL